MIKFTQTKESVLKFLQELVPLNILAIIFILLNERGLLNPLYLAMDIAPKNREHVFLFAVSALLMATLSYELIKATFLAPKGSGVWVDFTMSFIFLIALIVYSVKQYYASGRYPTFEYILLLEAQTLDVIVGFILTISNARRDLSIGK